MAGQMKRTMFLQPLEYAFGLTSKTNPRAAFYEVVFVKLQIRRRVNLPGRWIGFAILEIGKTTIHPASIFCS
jgi:hypothetical protein